MTQSDPQKRKAPKTDRPTGDPSAESSWQEPSPTDSPPAIDHADEQADNAGPAATVFASQVEDPAKLQAAEDDVPRHWQVGGVILDLYDVTEFLGAGYFGDVHKVHHRNWKINLAVKTPKRGRFSDTKKDEKETAEEAAFIAECERWIDLGLHPNIVTCHYVRRLGGVPRVFAEYVDGGSLKDWIDESRLCRGDQEEALKRVLDIAIQFAWGLHYAHQKGLVHQDIKPENLMMTNDGTPKLADFGLGHGGTQAYWSPEQSRIADMKEQGIAKEEWPVLTPATDLWSWGLCILEIFLGDRTWTSGTVAGEVLEVFLRTGPENESIPRMPESMANLLRKCFRTSAIDRPNNMHDVSDMLKDIYREFTGEEYVRDEPKPADLLADGLNNRAVSMLDLRRKGEAEKLYDQAIQVDPRHLEVTYNRGLLLWRCGRMTDAELVRQLEELRITKSANWRADYLLGLVHIERGDAMSAKELLKEARKQSAGDITVEAALHYAEGELAEPAKCIRSVCEYTKGRETEIRGVSVSRGGRRILTHTVLYERRRVLTDNFDSKICLWDAESGTKLKEIHQESPVQVVSFLNSERFAVVVTRSGQIQKWDLCKGECIREDQATLETVGGDCVVQYGAVSADGRRLVVGGGRDLQLWDLNSWKSWKADGDVNQGAVAALSDDGTIALYGDGRKARLLNASSGMFIMQFERRDVQHIQAAAISHDNLRVLTASDSDVLLWDIGAGTYIRSFKGHEGAVKAVAFANNSRWIVSGGRDSTVRLWDMISGQCLHTYVGHQKDVTAISVCAPDVVYSESRDGAVRCWRLGAGKRQATALSRPVSQQIISGHTKSVEEGKRIAHLALRRSDGEGAFASIESARCVPGFSKNRDLLDMRTQAGLLGRATAIAEIWHLKTMHAPPDSGRIVALSCDGNVALSCCHSGKVLTVWDSTTGDICNRWKVRDGFIDRAAISSDLRFAATAISSLSLKLLNLPQVRSKGHSGTSLSVWQLSNGECVSSSAVDNGQAECLAFSRGNKIVATCNGGEVTLWDVETAKRLRTISTRDKRVNCISFSTDDLSVLASGSSGRIKSWRMCDGKHYMTTHGVGTMGDGLPDVATSCMAVSRDMTLAITGTEPPGFLRQWNLCSGQSKKVLLEEETDNIVKDARKSVKGVVITPNMRYAVSSSSDKTIRIWDLRTGSCMSTLRGSRKTLSSLALSPEGRYLYAASGSEVWIWEVLWKYEFVPQVNWDEHARFYLETFLTLHRPYGEDGIRRVGLPVWNDEDFEELFRELQYDGYGWLRPEGVRAKLEKMTREWTGWQSLPDESLGAVETVATNPSSGPQQQQIKRIGAPELDVAQESNSALDVASSQDVRKRTVTAKQGKIEPPKPAAHILCSCGAESLGDNQFCTNCGERLPNGIDAAAGRPQQLPHVSTIRSSDLSQHSLDSGLDSEATLEQPELGDDPDARPAEVDAPAEWHVGDVILHRYEVKSLLSHGGFGIVYRVYDRERGIDFAVMNPRPELLITEQQRQVFIDHNRAWLDLEKHPNVLHCEGIQILGGIPGVFAEYVDGGSLHDWIDTKKLYEGGSALALRRVLETGRQIAAGLQHCHQQRVLHLNVKPSAVLMTSDGQVKLEGFDLSMTVRSGDRGVYCSAMTPAYCSPEQASELALTEKTDVWSLGLCILEMFVSERTWASGIVAREVLDNYLDTKPESASVPKMPDAVAGLLCRCFQRNPEARPTAGDIANELSKISRDVGKTPQLIEQLLSRAKGADREPVTIPGYTLEKELSRGAVATLYLAHQDKTGERVVVKVISLNAAVGKRSAAMWQREMKFIQRLNHPNIVRIFDCGLAGDVPFIIMEFCSGGDVAQLMRRRGGTLPVEEAVTILRHTLDGLSYLHEQGRIHRDLKPTNILLHGSDANRLAKVRVNDFFEWFIPVVGDASNVAGEPSFMPRQQMVNFKFSKPEVDVWAAAACLYNMLTGLYPRDFSQGQDPWRAALTTDPVPILERNADIPEAFAGAIDAALIDKPEIAVKTAAEFRQSLSDALRCQGGDERGR